MRGLVAQFIAPVLVVLVGATIGTLFDSSGTGILLGSAAAICLAVALALHAQRRLRRVALATRPDAVVNLSRAGHEEPYDDINVVLNAVEQLAAASARRRALDSQLLDEQTLVLDRMNDGLMRVGADGRINYANVAAGTLFGGRNPTSRSFIAVTRDHELYQAVLRCLETGEEQHHTLEIAGEGALVNAVALRLNHQPPEALVMLRDITEVNRLQNLRRDFVANVSHELRTPLSTIKILTETLLDIRDNDPEASEFLRKIDAEVDSMTALVRDLLDLTRLESLGGRLSLRAVDVAALIADVSERMQPLAERQRVELVAETDGSTAEVAIDERRLHQALINLMTNAIAHTPAGGTVTIGSRRDGEMSVFWVRDTGTGIPADDLPRIWERFFKADRARTGPGTGLGLAIVKHIAQAHGGTVAVTSQPGKGSEFSISVPIRSLPRTIRHEDSQPIMAPP